MEMELPLLKNFRTFTEIQNSVWTEYGCGKVYGIPEKHSWNKDSQPTVKDIKIWEQVYHEPGNVGIYAAHDPRVELYIITYYPILDDDFNGVEYFYGEDAVTQVLKAADRLNISIEQKLIPTQ